MVTVVVQKRYMQEMTESGRRGGMFSGRGCLTFLGKPGVDPDPVRIDVGRADGGCDGRGRGQADRHEGEVARSSCSRGAIGTLLFSFLAIVAGFICLIFPGVYLTLGLSFAVPVMAAEGLYGSGALGRSWKLVRYNPHKGFLANTSTKVFLLYLVTGLIAYAINFVVQLPFLVMQGARVAHAVASGAARQTRRRSPARRGRRSRRRVLGSLVTTAVSIYSAFGIVLLYLDVVRRKEGGDLAAAIDARFGGPSRVSGGATGMIPAAVSASTQAPLALHAADEGLLRRVLARHACRREALGARAHRLHRRARARVHALAHGRRSMSGRLWRRTSLSASRSSRSPPSAWASVCSPWPFCAACARSAVARGPASPRLDWAEADGRPPALDRSAWRRRDRVPPRGAATWRERSRRCGGGWRRR